jgi:D-glycero-D-manno-heptose 1,7-bisphosphate phosphatase
LIDTVFVDRDGTLNVKAPEGEYVTHPDQVVLLPGVADAVRRLNDAGVPVVVITNQRGVSRGAMSLSDVEAVQTRLDELLAEQGAHVDAVYVCPHAADSCDCRKPLPGLLLRARDEREIDLARAVMIGDAASDVAAGRRAAVRTVRLGDVIDAAADHTAASLADAVDWLDEQGMLGGEER